MHRLPFTVRNPMLYMIYRQRIEANLLKVSYIYTTTPANINIRETLLPGKVIKPIGSICGMKFIPMLLQKAIHPK